MGKTFKVSSLDDMCSLMCDNSYKGLEEQNMEKVLENGIKVSTVNHTEEQTVETKVNKKVGRKSKAEKALEAQKAMTAEEKEAIEKEREEYIIRISALETTLEKFKKCNDVEAFVVGGVFFDKNDISNAVDSLDKMITLYNLCVK